MQLHAHYQKSHLHFVCNSNCNLFFQQKLLNGLENLEKKAL